MPRLILNLEKSIEIPFKPGSSVREILDGTDFRVRTGCTGTGACGLCVVRIAGGGGDGPTSAEKIHLDEADLGQGMRLACQVRPTRDLEIDRIRFAPKSDWKKPVRPRHKCYAPVQMTGLPADVGHPKAVAVDLGTTLVRVSLWDLTTGCYVTGRVGFNPQRASGTDVISRLMAASESGGKAHALRRQVMGAIGAALRDMALTEGMNLRD
jgi:ferredoxin